MVATGLAVLSATALTGVASAREPSLVEDTPCGLGVRACVSLRTQQAWLIENDKISVGPVDIATGGPGDETPVGDFTVEWKNKNHVSSEHQTPDGQPSPMPYSVFFAKGGIAFHQGDLDRASAGCVRLERENAILFYNTLPLGAKVQVRS
jgi:lipoprotein-anchoring transpeptidase ErfK/SrfK